MASSTTNDRNTPTRNRATHLVQRAWPTLLFLLAISAGGARCQSSIAAGQSGVDASSSANGNGSGDSFDIGGLGGPGTTSSAGDGGVVQQSSLSSAQIISLLQQNPDLLAEFKSEYASRLQQQGIQLDPNDISDQTLYNQIASNARLRASITTILRTRGDLAAGDSQSFGSATEGAISQSAIGSGGSKSDRIPGVDVGANPVGISEMAGFGESRQDRPRRTVRAGSSTEEPTIIQQATPLDFQSLRDLYAQIPNQTVKLDRFGSDVFVNRMASATGRGIAGRDSPLDVPLGPDYIVGAGDKLTIDLWGGVTQSIARTVDRDGRILLPEAGVVQVAGLSLGKVQSVIESALRPQFRNAQIAVTVSGLRSIRVYVVGDVQRPGGYDISALATPLSILYAAGGPTAIGSLRTLRHLRASQLIEEVDLYDFLLQGIRKGSAQFQSGDTLLVPPAGPQVAVSGAVKRQAIYELRAGETTLATVMADAGGVTSVASLSHIKIERIDANHQRETVTLPKPASNGDHGYDDALTHFQVRDGDRIVVEPILPYSQRAIYLIGHVARPGRMAYVDGMRLSDVLRSYQDMLPEPAAHGEIVRLVPPELHAETIDFSVPDVLIGNANIDLRPFDTVRVFGRYQVDAPKVSIRGEVMRPGEYPMFNGMTAAQLVRMAGGFKRDALTESADLTSYNVDSGREVTEKLTTVRIGAAVTGAGPDADVPLQPGDILAIHQITNWANIGESVTIQGQVRYPGSYGFHDGERLSSVLFRTGGMLSTAYPAGAVLIREQVKGLEQSSRDALVRQIEANSAAARLSPATAGANSAGALQLIKAQQDQVLSELQSHPPTGRMVIHISADIESWANTPADIELRPGDVLTIPKRPGFVLVTGQVYNATALTYTPNKTAGWYLSHAGGTNSSANRKEVFVIRANGSVVGRRSGGFFGGDVLSTKLDPGDVVVVPQKVIGGSMLWRNLLTAGQLAASTAITAGVAAAAL
jgi:protein involved in polysaccharide export with SLBB domain